MTAQPLDALALTVLDDVAKTARIAALWCRSMGDEPPENRKVLARWVKHEFGPVLDPDNVDFLINALIEEIYAQMRLRARRKREHAIQDSLLDRDLGSRISRLLTSALGPARKWVSKTRLHGNEIRYCAGQIRSGLIAALLPASIRVGDIRNPNLLVYRETGFEPKSFWIPGSVFTVDEAFVWVIPQPVKDLLAEFEGQDLQVELVYEAQAVSVSTPYGTKLVPWRGLQQEGE